VVPLDGNPLAEQALPMAVNLATALQVPVHLVRVVDFDPVRASILAGPAAAAASARQHAELARVAQAYLTRLADQYQAPGLTITSEVRVGDPVPELLAVFQPEDLAVLATHARGGLARWFVGSVAEAIVQRGAGPVLLVRSGLQVPSAERGAFNREGSHT
jgi:nucleotide-binding universal stress UspA family protein